MFTVQRTYFWNKVWKVSCLHFLSLSHVSDNHIQNITCRILVDISDIKIFLLPIYRYQHHPKKIPFQLGPNFNVGQHHGQDCPFHQDYYYLLIIIDVKVDQNTANVTKTNIWTTDKTHCCHCHNTQRFYLTLFSTRHSLLLQVSGSHTERSMVWKPWLGKIREGFYLLCTHKDIFLLTDQWRVKDRFTPLTEGKQTYIFWFRWLNRFFDAIFFKLFCHFNWVLKF